MLKLTIVAIFALLLSSSPSSIHALPTPSASSSSTVVGQVPTVTNLQGIVDPQLFQENLLHTFAKYRFVPVVDNATSTLMNGTGSLHSRRVYQKRGQDLPTRIDLGVITREPAIGLYTANMGFGTPTQTRSLLLDTGSSDLFIQTGCNLPAGCGGNFLFRKSTTYRDTGRVVTDRVTFGGRTIEDQAFLMVSDAHTPGAAGNIGLALNAQSNREIGTPLIENLRATGQLGNGNGFSLQLDRNGNNAFLTLGINVEAGAPTIPYMKFNVMYPNLLGRWALEMKVLSSLPDRNLWQGSVAVFIDSGSSSSFVPREAARIAHSQVEHFVETVPIPLQGQVYDVDIYFYPCDAKIDYAIQFTDWRQFRADPRDQALGSDGNGMCQSMLNGVDIEYNGLKAGILGAPWLKSKDVQFHVGSDSSNTGATIGIRQLMN
ncbi:acid protease [Rhodotorula sp. JG-1b]|nr:acid protease [Rhodotorula sp. JG-1b]